MVRRGQWFWATGVAATVAASALLFVAYPRTHIAVAKRAVVEADDLYNPVQHLLKRGRRDQPSVCLTIDDGPHPKCLPSILRTLDEFGVKATFFMVGKRITERPDLVREVLRRGHEVGNHTQNHARLDSLAPDQVRIELALCENSFEAATGGLHMHLFRPPGMRFTPEILKVANEFGYTTVDWNYGGKDFTIFSSGPESGKGVQVAQYVLERVQPGGIILLHDSPDTADALPTILEGLRAEGLSIVTVTGLLAALPDPVYVKSNAGMSSKVASR